MFQIYNIKCDLTSKYGKQAAYFNLCVCVCGGGGYCITLKTDAWV